MHTGSLCNTCIAWFDLNEMAVARFMRTGSFQIRYSNGHTE